MPVKKTTKSPAKNVKAVEKKMEPVVVKSPSVKKSISEKTSSGVIVKEKAMSNSCNSYGECKVGKFLMMLILLVNTVLLVMIFVYSRSGLQTQFRQVLEEFEMHRVGGQQNYDVMQQIYNLDSYKNDQKKRLDVTLQQLQQLEISGGELPYVAPDAE